MSAIDKLLASGLGSEGLGTRTVLQAVLGREEVPQDGRALILGNALAVALEGLRQRPQDKHLRSATEGLYQSIWLLDEVGAFPRYDLQDVLSETAVLVERQIAAQIEAIRESIPNMDEEDIIRLCPPDEDDIIHSVIRQVSQGEIFQGMLDTPEACAAFLRAHPGLASKAAEERGNVDLSLRGVITIENVTKSLVLREVEERVKAIISEKDFFADFTAETFMGACHEAMSWLEEYDGAYQAVSSERDELAAEIAAAEDVPTESLYDRLLSLESTFWHLADHKLAREMQEACQGYLALKRRGELKPAEPAQHLKF